MTSSNCMQQCYSWPAYHNVSRDLPVRYFVKKSPLQCPWHLFGHSPLFCQMLCSVLSIDVTNCMLQACAHYTAASSICAGLCQKFQTGAARSVELEQLRSNLVIHPDANLPFAVQASSLFTVIASAVGCLYLMDTSGSFVANSRGINAVAVLLVLLNSIFVLVMLILIAIAGYNDHKPKLLWAYHKLKCGWASCTCQGRRKAPRGTASSGMQLQSQTNLDVASRTGSTQILMNSVLTTSGDLTHADSL